MNTLAVMIPDMPSSHRRPTKFTPERMDQIRNLVERGCSHEEIAEAVGCTTGTLKVMCSKLGISLRRPRLDNGIGNGSTKQQVKTLPVKCAPVCSISNEPEHENNDTKEAASDGGSPPRISSKPPVFALRFCYRGIERSTDIPLSEEQLGRLALEAEMHGLRIGELIAKIIVAVVEKNLFEQVTKWGRS